LVASFQPGSSRCAGWRFLSATFKFSSDLLLTFSLKDSEFEHITIVRVGVSKGVHRAAMMPEALLGGA